MPLAISVVLLVAVLAFAVVRPRGFAEGVFAVPAAAAAVASCSVPWDAARAELVALAPVVAFLAAVLALAYAAGEWGVFSYLGSIAARLSGASPSRLLLAVVVVASGVTATLTLDATVTLLTPVILATTLRMHAAAFGCPFEGEVSSDRLRQVISDVAAAGPDELALADTIGVAVPADVTRGVELAREIAPDTPLRCHFHNTRNTGLANALAAMQAGVRALDASTGGIGGCPFAPAATGNIPTEDLLYLLHRSGVHTGVDVEQVMQTARRTGELLSAQVPGLLSRAGVFPAAG